VFVFYFRGWLFHLAPRFGLDRSSTINDCSSTINDCSSTIDDRSSAINSCSSTIDDRSSAINSCSSTIDGCLSTVEVGDLVLNPIYSKTVRPGAITHQTQLSQSLRVIKPFQRRIVFHDCSSFPIKVEFHGDIVFPIDHDRI